MKRERIRIVIHKESQGLGSMSIPALDLRHWLDEAPPEYRNGCIMFIEASEDGGDDIDLELSIAYYRDETDEEMAARERTEGLGAAVDKRRDLARLAALKLKYPEY